MRLSTWNLEEIRQNFSACITLGDAIAKLESDFLGHGEVICEVSVNGMPLSEDDEARLQSSPMEDIQDLVVASARPENLIRDAMSSAERHISDLVATSLQTSDQFRGADLAEAQLSFTHVLEGCHCLVDMIVNLQRASSGMEKPIGQTQTWQEASRQIRRVVTEVSGAYEAQDHVLVADLLEYELSAALDLWKSAFAAEQPAPR